MHLSVDNLALFFYFSIFYSNLKLYLKNVKKCQKILKNVKSMLFACIYLYAIPYFTIGKNRKIRKGFTNRID